MSPRLPRQTPNELPNRTARNFFNELVRKAVSPRLPRQTPNELLKAVQINSLKKLSETENQV